MKLKNKEVRIETTTVCNSNCTICPRDKLTRRLTTMPNWKFEQLVNQAWDMGADTISLFGFGEPLCDPKLSEKIAMCHKLGLKTFITTNGSLLSVDAGYDLIKAGLTHIRFSAHGLYHTYEKVHRGLKFHTFLRNFANFTQINEGRVIVSVSVIPMHDENIEWIKEFYKPGEIADYLEIWRPHNWTDGREFRDVKPRRKTCGRPFNGPVQINSDGKMMVCCFDYNGVMTVGDTYYQSIQEILGGKEFREIREKHKAGDLRGLPCETCDQLNVEEDSPLLYSNRDPERKINCTSSTKFQLEEI